MYYHLVWRTKESLPLITPAMEPLLHKYLIHRALETPEAIVHAVGGIEDHVHMAVSLPPTVEVAKWIGDIKGASSHAINHGPCGAGALAWQVGYGVVTFGAGDLEWVAAYVRNQREHHASGKTPDRLERITQLEVVAPEGGIQSKPVETG
jgi:putative transposase